MAIRVRADGTMVCAAHSKPQPGDTYIDDGLHYQMSVEHGVIVSLPMPEHEADPRWWWRGVAPTGADMREWIETLPREEEPIEDTARRVIDKYRDVLTRLKDR